MSQPNEKLIRSIFDTVILHRPALSRYLVVDDEDDDEEEVDFRLLGDQLIRNYPWPVGVELRRLFSVWFRPTRRWDRHR